MLKQHGCSANCCILHGGHQMSVNIAAGFGLGGNESYPDLFLPYGCFPDSVRVENGYLTLKELTGFVGKSDLIRECASTTDKDRTCPNCRASSAFRLPSPG